MAALDEHKTGHDAMQHIETATANAKSQILENPAGWLVFPKLSSVGRDCGRPRRSQLRRFRTAARRACPSSGGQQPPPHRPLMASHRRGVAQTSPAIPGASHEQATSSAKPWTQAPSHRPLISSQRRGVAQTRPVIPGASHEQAPSPLEAEFLSYLPPRSAGEATETIIETKPARAKLNMALFIISPLTANHLREVNHFGNGESRRPQAGCGLRRAAADRRSDVGQRELGRARRVPRRGGGSRIRR